MGPAAARDVVLTFLFTDVESSSALWEADPVQMQAALEVHDRLGREAVGAAGGEIVKHLGDGLYAVFASAEAAVTAAVDFMRMLQSEVLVGLELPFSVRMGLHTGAASARDGDYFGRAVNRAARIMNSANGNQIVVSEATASFDPGHEYVDHGIHELKGVGLERLFVLCDDGLLVDPRPLRVSRSSNLPVDTNAFVGRAIVLSELVQRLQELRSVTLVGPGGVGKTRLGVHVAERLADQFRDGTWFCDLAAVADESSVGPLVAEIIGAPPLPGRSMAERISAHLAQHEALLILDNCEHVRQEVRLLTERLLRQAPRCVVLATSREPLERNGEHVIRVNPLDAGEALDLFVRRARERDAQSVIDDAAEEWMRRICQQLDGLPLAIELAAARLSMMSPAAMSRRLADRFRLLRGHSAIGRQATLWNTIDWSYHLLSTVERGFFDRLSVFRGGFTFEAAAAICGDGADEYEVLDVLAGLVDKSMVQSDPNPAVERFALLDSLRDFGREHLERLPEAEEVIERHIGWYTHLVVERAQQLYGADEASAWYALAAEWDNVRLALQQALERGRLDDGAEIITALHYFSVIALRFEGLSWSDMWLAHPGASTHGRVDEIEAVASSAAYTSMDLDRSRRLALAGLEHDLDWRAMPFVAIWAFLGLGDVSSAERFVGAWSAAQRASPPGPFHRSMVEAAAAVFEGTMRRDALEAEAHLQLMEEIAASVGAPSARAYARMVRGIALARIDPEQSLAALGEAELEARKLGGRHAFIDGSQTAAAQILAKDSDLRVSLRRCRDALSSAAEHQFLPRIAHDLQSAAIALARADRVEAGARLLGTSQAMGQRTWHDANRLLEAQLAPDDFERFVSEGRALQPQQAATLAIEVLDGCLSLVDPEPEA